ncbi:MAG: acyl-ACP--UDP-N-acetylglucosamine O-acyltransferase [Rhizobiales bacterium]|nr:acyl-ACP--UDP-N-acetylglucosamine O-acyltransferase [Hyphomicrobiales bacterium]
MTRIHPTAIIGDGVQIADDVIVGAYCVLEGDIVIGPGCELKSHVVIAGRTTIGRGNTIFPFASIGHVPQDLKYHGEPSRLEIGDNNRIREHVTINPGTEGGGMLTKVGSNCLLMVGSHVGHDCLIGDNVILANNATVAGHCVIEEFAILGGLSAVHQFVRIGAHAFLGGMSGLENDLIPFGTAVGDRASLQGLNLVGLKRRGFDREQIHGVRKAYRMLFATEGTLQERMHDVEEEFGADVCVQRILEFIRASSHRALCLPDGR